MIDGVIRTRVGYAGGRQPNPTYRRIGDHTETVQVDYDPRRITYADLLAIFWRSHKPTSGSGPRQYMRAVFYHNEQQRQLALASKTAIEKKIGQEIKTEVVPLRTFTLAENYHQKYILKQHYNLKAEMTGIYPQDSDFINSTAVARLNGYAGGHGTVEQLSQEIDRLGLSEAGRQTLTEMVNRHQDYDRQ